MVERAVPGIIQRVPCCGIVKQPYQKGNGAGDMNERIDPIGQVHQHGSVQEKLLNIGFEKYSQRLFDLNEL
jgi:hypothetical protein